MPALFDTCDAPVTNDTLRALVCRAASAFDPSALDRDEAVEALHEWSAILHAASAASAMAASRVAECGPPPAAGASSAADYVARATGTSTNRARDDIRLGDGMRAHAKTRSHATNGELSRDKAVAITDAIEVNPAAEVALLASADGNPVGVVRDECAKAKAAKQDLETIEKQIHTKRHVRRWRDRDGAEHLHAVGTKRDMARLDRELKPLVDEVFNEARQDGVRQPLEAYMFDALMCMADRSVDGGTSTRARGNPTRYLTILRLDLEALTRGDVEDGETCEIAGLGPISVQAAREMLGESLMKLVITKGVDAATMTHLGRGPNLAQKIALLWQQPVCSRKGCGRTARLEYDHREEWSKVRCTELRNSDPLCDPDHDLKTYSGWALVEGTGVRDMVPPDDWRHPRNRPPP